MAGSKRNHRIISIVVASALVLTTIFILWPSQESIENTDLFFQEEIEAFKEVRRDFFRNTQKPFQKSHHPSGVSAIDSVTSDKKASVLNREKILKQDDLCEMARLSGAVPELVASLESEEIQDAYDILKSGKSRGNNLSPNAANFLKALYFSGLLLAEPQSPAVNISEAENYWHRLFQEDPKNAVVYFFYLGFLQKKGAAASEMTPYVLATINAEHFRNYYFDFTGDIWNKSLLNSSYYLQNISILMSAPFPDYISVMNALKAVVTQTQDQELKTSLREWILKRAKHLQQSNGEWEGIEWSKLEYTVLNSVAKKMGFELPDLGNPRKLSQSLQEWRDFQTQALGEIIEEENEGRCQPEKFKYFFKEEKERYLQMKSKKAAL